MIYLENMMVDILNAVSEVTGVSVEAIKSKSIKKGLSEARGIYFAIGKLAGLNPNHLSELINKTPSSAVALGRKYQLLFEKDVKYKKIMDQVIELLGSGAEFDSITKPLWTDEFHILNVSSIYSGDCYIGVVNGIPSMQEKSFHCLVNRMLDLISEKHE